MRKDNVNSTLSLSNLEQKEVVLVDKLRPGIRVYGPYVQHKGPKKACGRKHVLLYDGVCNKTISYPKWLMEQHLGRFLTSEETVDHIDRDKTNDKLENLQVLDKKKHLSLDATYAAPVTLRCIFCNQSIVRKRKDVRHNSNKGKAGPFCRSCAGRYGAELQNGRCEKLLPQESVDLIHFKLSKTGS